MEQQSKTGVRSNSLDDVKLLEQLKQMKKTLEGALIEQKVLLEEKAKVAIPHFINVITVGLSH